MNKYYHIIVIGGGPAGLMSAITAAKNRKRVLVIDHNDKVAKKIYATGNGKCNFTNEYMEPSCFHGDEKLVENVLSMFSERDTIHTLHGMGILPKSKGGYVYPNSEQASSVAHALEQELQTLAVDVLLNHRIDALEQKKGDYYIYVGDDVYRANKIIIATGLLAAPKLGSDGSFFPFLKEMGHSFEKIVPALCGFYCEGISFKHASGVRQEGLVSLWVDDEYVEEDFGEIQFTDYGLSGIPVFQISSKASKSLKEKKKVSMKLNFFSSFSREELLAELKYRALMFDETSEVKDIWNGLLNDKLCNVLLSTKGINEHTLVKELSEQSFERMVDALTETVVSVMKPRDYEFAQVCAGGIRTEEIDTRTLESKICPNMFFAGEILNVDGICGGYNLQWAFSSGYVAGEFASR